MFRLSIAVLLGPALCQISYAAPPKELYGKSVIVTWTETRDQRAEGELAWHSIQGAQALNIYVSETGRVFNDLHYSTKNGSADRGGQIAGQGGNRAITFSGRSMLMMSAHGKGGANRISADFDSSFASCTAEVLKAKESEQTIVKSYSQIIKHMVEIRGIQVSGTACSVRSGNVFGN
jgi:hypothetical protein